MSWFDEQINARRENDSKTMSDSYETIVNSVVGERFSFDEAKDAISLILSYYRLPEVKIPESIKDNDEKLSAVCRISGLMQRRVNLSNGWYKESFGAFLGVLKENDEYVALIPDKFGKYHFYDKKLHKRVRINRKTQKLLKPEAICFYKPLPNKKLSTFDIVKFGVMSWSVADYLYTLIIMLATALVGLLSPKLSYFLFSEVLESGKMSVLVSTVVFIVCVNITTVLLNAMKAMFTSRTSVKMNSAVKTAVMMRVLSLPTGFFRNYSSGEILQRMGYVESICTSVVNALFSTGLTSIFSLIYITQIFKYAPALVLPSLIIICVNVAFSVITTALQIKVSKVRMEIGAKNNGIGISMVSGIQKIKLSGSEKRMFSRWVNAFAEETRVTYNPPVFIKINGAIALGIGLIGQFVMYYMTIGSDVSLAEYYAFQTAYSMVYAAISSLVSMALQVADLKPSLEMARPIMETLPETNEKVHDVTSLSGAIELNGITFRYSEDMPNVIDDFNLKIRPGQYVAIVGKTGCGKSTLVRLLLGFEKPQKGAIYYDGKDINTLEKKSLRRKIGTVMQDDKLFMGDIYSNIVICAPKLPLSAAWEAAELSGIADDIRNMPMGMNTLISDGSGGISGGQRQRLLIARAIAPKPKILIFDEATSALDNITQKKVSEALDSLKCTRIVIAHRLSTIRHCDRIIVMDGGKITEDGTYDELIAKNGYFASLVERQRLDKE